MTVFVTVDGGQVTVFVTVHGRQVTVFVTVHGERVALHVGSKFIYILVRARPPLTRVAKRLILAAVTRRSVAKGGPGPPTFLRLLRV